MSDASIRTIVAESWNQLWDELYEGSWNVEISCFRSPYVFRGVDDCDSALETGLARLVGVPSNPERLRGIFFGTSKNMPALNTSWMIPAGNGCRWRNTMDFPQGCSIGPFLL